MRFPEPHRAGQPLYADTKEKNIAQKIHSTIVLQEVLSGFFMPLFIVQFATCIYF